MIGTHNGPKTYRFCDFDLRLSGRLDVGGHDGVERSDQRFRQQQRGRLRRRSDRSNQLYWNLWVELGGGIRWPPDRAHQFRNAGIWLEYGRRIRRKTNRINDADLAAVQREPFRRGAIPKPEFRGRRARQCRGRARRSRSGHLHRVLNLTGRQSGTRVINGTCRVQASTRYEQKIRSRCSPSP